MLEREDLLESDNVRACFQECIHKVRRADIWVDDGIDQSTIKQPELEKAGVEREEANRGH